MVRDAWLFRGLRHGRIAREIDHGQRGADALVVRPGSGSRFDVDVVFAAIDRSMISAYFS